MYIILTTFAIIYYKNMLNMFWWLISKINVTSAVAMLWEMIYKSFISGEYFVTQTVSDVWFY